MANKLYEESNIAAIATAIRAKNGSSDTYTVSEMAPAINALLGRFEVPATMCFSNSTFSTLPQNITFASRTSCSFMFAYNPNLTTVPLFDTSLVTEATAMFSDCESLSSVPFFDFSSLQTATEMFGECFSLTTIPQFNFSLVTHADSTFYYCEALETVPVFNLSSLISAEGMFGRCNSLTNTSLQNILKSLLTVPSSYYASARKLKTIGLSSAQATTCTGFPEWATLTAAGWTTGY